MTDNDAASQSQTNNVVSNAPSQMDAQPNQNSMVTSQDTSFPTSTDPSKTLNKSESATPAGLSSPTPNLITSEETTPIPSKTSRNEGKTAVNKTMQNVTDKDDPNRIDENGEEEENDGKVEGENTPYLS